MRFWTVYRVVFRKELRELLRDRRSLFWLFAPPIILPGLALCAGLFIGTQAIRIANDGFPVWVENGEQAPELVQRFEDDDATYLVDPPPDPATDPFGDALILVRLPDDFADEVAAGQTVSVEMITRDSSVITFLAEGAVRGVLNSYKDDLLEQRLATQGLTRDWLDPLRINAGKQTETGSVVAGDDDGDTNILATIFLPLAVTSWLIGGGMGLILDATVGEKERQTIENLLVTPASRVGIVLGKMTVVFLASLAVMGLWLSEGIALSALSTAGPDLLEADSLTATQALEIIANSGGNIFGLVGALVVLIIPFIVTLNGLVMAWCARAANYREANLFMVLMQLGLPASILLTIFSLPASVSAGVYAIPFFGTIVAIRDLFSNALPLAGLVINVATGLVYGVLSLALAAWVFNKEWSLTRGLQ